MVTKRDQGVGVFLRPSHGEELARSIRDVSVAREGNRVVVPEGMDLETAIAALQAKVKEEETTVVLNFDYDLMVPEGALALYQTLNDLYGFVNAMSTPGFWGDTPPQILNVQVARDKSVMIPWGRFSVPGVDGYIETSIDERNDVPYFGLRASVPGKFKKDIERIHDVINSRSDSVYRGTAVALAFPEKPSSIKDYFPRFMELASLTSEDLVFSDDVEEVLSVSLFTPIEHTDFCRENNIPLKRGILLEGPYGVGKTLTATVTAGLAEEHGWTFIQLAQVKDLAKAYTFAKHHQPAVIFCEDLDEVLKDEDERDETINGILNSIDGIESKNVEIITVFTTNNVQDITKAMLRPGRIDTVVSVRAPDSKAVQRLIRLFAQDKLAAGADLTTAAALLAGKNAAVVREVVERSKLGAVRRLTYKGQALVVTAHDIEVAARGMDAHNKLLEPNPVDSRSHIEKAAEILGDKLLQLGAGISHSNGSSNGASSWKLPEGGKAALLEGPKGSTTDAE